MSTSPNTTKYHVGGKHAPYKVDLPIFNAIMDIVYVGTVLNQKTVVIDGEQVVVGLTKEEIADYCRRVGGSYAVHYALGYIREQGFVFESKVGGVCREPGVRSHGGRDSSQ